MKFRQCVKAFFKIVMTCLPLSYQNKIKLKNYILTHFSFFFKGTYMYYIWNEEKNKGCEDDKIPLNRDSDKKIVFFSHDAYFHGAQLLSVHIVRVLNTVFGYDVHVILNTGGELEGDFKKYATIYNLEKDYSSLENQISLIDTFLSIGVKTAICNTVVSGDFLKKLAVKGIKTIALVHELPGVIHQYHCEEKAKNIAEYAYRSIFPSDYVRDKFAAIVKLDYNKSLIAPQGLFTENKYKNKKSEASKKLREVLVIPDGCDIILAVGIADYRKGVDLFFEIAERVVKQYSDICFVWVGNRGTNDFAEIWQKIKSSVIYKNRNIVFIDPLYDISIYFAGADLFLLTSREDPFPSVVLQSMEVGVPVIGFMDAGGFGDVINENTGILVPFLDTNAMTDAILELVKNSSKTVELGANSAALIHSKFQFLDYVSFLLNTLGENTK